MSLVPTWAVCFRSAKCRDWGNTGSNWCTYEAALMAHLDIAWPLSQHQ